MPTISHLPATEGVAASDLIPISQSGSTRAVSVGELLASTQPAIMVSPPCLLGRVSIGPGGPDTIAIGDGLILTQNTLAANYFNASSLANETNISPGDKIITVNSGGTHLLPIGSIRGLFSAGGNISISPEGTIAAGISGANGTNTIVSLPEVTTAVAADWVGISQGGVDHKISRYGLLGGITIDLAQAASTAADTDTLWVGQGGNVMARQTLGALWTWLAKKIILNNKNVFDATADIVLDGLTHNNTLITCNAPLIISAISRSFVSGFSCEIVNLSAGTVALASNIISSNGSGALTSNQSASIKSLPHNGGTVLFAAITTSAVATSPPTEITNLSVSAMTSVSISLLWQNAASVGAGYTYTIKFRTAGTSTWSTSGSGVGLTAFTVSGLLPNTSYDFGVVPSNNAGAGPISSIVNATTPANGSVPGPPLSLRITAASTASISCAWLAPSAGGTPLSYKVDYRATGQTAWIGAGSGIAATNMAISNLLASTYYDLRVSASNASGMGVASDIMTTTTSSGAAGLVASVSWNLAPTGSFTRGSGAIGVNAHVNPSSASVQFGFSTSSTVQPSSWVVGVNVNSDLWGAYVPTPVSVGTWYAWVEGTDGSSATVNPVSFSVT